MMWTAVSPSGGARDALSKGVVAFVILLALGLQWVHLEWERQGGARIPDAHIYRFLTLARQTQAWLEVGGSPPPGSALQGRGPFPPTRDYPPATFLVAAVGLETLGPTPTAARLSQGVFVLAFVLLMARIGWQLAGRRGAALLALAAAGSPWIAQYQREFSMVLAEMAMVALAFSLLLDTRGLTRPGWCAALGFALGLGMLVKQSFLFFAAPLLVAASVPVVVSSVRSARLGLVLVWLLVTVAAVVSEALESLPRHAVSGVVYETERLFMVEGLFLLMVGIALWNLRTGRWTPGAGLLLAVGVAGATCSPWYMVHLPEMAELMRIHEVALRPIGPVQQMGSYLAALQSFYAFGLAWLGLGILGMLCWPPMRRTGLVLTLAVAGVVAIHCLAMPPQARYLPPVAALVLPLAFLWLAHSRTTFALAVLVLAPLGLLQVAGFHPDLRETLPLETYPVRNSVGNLWWNFAAIPIAEPVQEARPLVQTIPAGSRVGLVRRNSALRCGNRSELVRYLDAYLSARARIEILPDVDPDLEGLDYLIVAAGSREELPRIGEPGTSYSLDAGGGDRLHLIVVPLHG